MNTDSGAIVRFGGHCIGPGERCFIIAEAGVNHNGSLKLALQMVDAAADAGADAVKFQTFISEKLVTAHAAKATYQVANTGTGGSQLEMLRRLELLRQDYDVILDRCASRQILFLSTPFEEESAEFLAAVGVPALKVASGDLNNIPFLEYLGSKNLPILLSTGMGTLDEVRAAVRALRGAPGLVLLHCVSSYPAMPAEANLRAIDTMRHAFGLPVGYSDHTEGLEVALASVAVGAAVLEKHFTLGRSLPGPDQKASLEPPELSQLVRSVRLVEMALGHGRKEPVASELSTISAARKSLVAACDIPAGTRLELCHLSRLRPGTGMAPSEIGKVIGHSTKVALSKGDLILPTLLQ